MCRVSATANCCGEMAAAEGISAKTTSDLDRLGRQAHGRRGSGGQALPSPLQAAGSGGGGARSPERSGRYLPSRIGPCASRTADCFLKDIEAAESSSPTAANVGNAPAMPRHDSAYSRRLVECTRGALPEVPLSRACICFPVLNEG